MMLRERRLEDVLDFYDHQRIPLNSFEREHRQGEYRYYGAQGVIDHIDAYIFDGEYVLIPEDGANLVTRNDPIAFVVDGQFWVNNHAHVVRGKAGEADNRYVAYLLNSLTIAGYITGVAQPKLSQNNLRLITVRIPGIQAQERVVATLRAYDDLIENNNRRIALLEQAARLLYEEWFVRLRFPGREHTRIVDGVPRGWKRVTVSEITSFLKRGIAPQYDDDAAGLVINQKCVRDGRLNVGLARHQAREFGPDRQVQVGDVLVNSTGEGTLGRVAQVKAPVENCTVDTHVTIVRPAGVIGVHYFGLAMLAYEPLLSTMGRGATNQTELSPTQIGAVEILVPSRTLMDQFEGFAGPIYEQITNLTGQNQKSRAARDLLLPRLMSGEIAA